MPSDTVIDLDRQAAAFDQYLTLMAPVADRLAEPLGELEPGATVVDIGCGTGEPGLTLLEHHPKLQLLGIDASAPLLVIARHKAQRRGLDQARFEEMNSQALAIDGGSVEAVVSRFGLLSFADPLVEAGELARILRPGGTLCIAAWDAVTMNTASFAIMTAAWEQLPGQTQSALRNQEPFTMLGRREAWLTDAGFSDLRSELFAWHAEFPDEESLWRLMSGPGVLGAIAGQLEDDVLAGIRQRFQELLQHCRRPDGSYRLPYACRVITARR